MCELKQMKLRREARCVLVTGVNDCLHDGGL